MQTAISDSSLEIISWFIKRAKKDDIYLEYKKIQNLIFLAQIHYCASFNGKLLMPCVFTATNEGFEEPTFAQLYSNGIIPNIKIRLNTETTSFLEKIWQIYSRKSTFTLDSLIKNRIGIFPNNNGEKNIPNLNSLVEKFKSSSTITNNKENSNTTTNKKVMLSQNGPVMVSQWKPRKITSPQA